MTDDAAPDGRHPDESVRQAEEPRRGFSRRHVLLGGAAAGIGAGLALVGDALLGYPGSRPSTMAPTAGPSLASRATTVAFFGPHQGGIETPVEAHATLIAFDLNDDVDREKVRRMLTILTDDGARLTQGEPALADSEPELALVPAGLTVMFGFGPGLVDRVAPQARPPWLAPLPSFGTDRLQETWCGGDLLVQLSANDPITLAHASRMVTKDAAAFASVRWTQAGFRRAWGVEPAGTTMRNLMGQVDGTVNMGLGSSDFADVVWATRSNPSWLAGGTSMVVRRISMDLATWDRLDRTAREAVIGRRLDTGAPLTGTREFDEPDFEAVDALGFPVIADSAHMRRARSSNTAERIFRRPLNYEVPASATEPAEAGLIFIAFQADAVAQYVPLQARIDELDLLNEWTTPIGSAVFAIPPGCRRGGFIGETLFAA